MIRRARLDIQTRKDLLEDARSGKPLKQVAEENGLGVESVRIYLGHVPEAHSPPYRERIAAINAGLDDGQEARALAARLGLAISAVARVQAGRAREARLLEDAAKEAKLEAEAEARAEKRQAKEAARQEKRQAKEAARAEKRQAKEAEAEEKRQAKEAVRAARAEEKAGRAARREERDARAARSAKRRERDARVVASYMAGEPVASIAARENMGRGRVSAIAYRAKCTPRRVIASRKRVAS